MDRKIYPTFVCSLIFLCTARFASSLTNKCCPLQYELTFSDVPQVIPRAMVDCVKSNGSQLTVNRPANITNGLPNCTRFELVDVYNKSSPVHCVDRVKQFNTIFGLRCVDEPVGTHPTFTIPSILNFRKCCPPNRKYDAEKQFCWNHRAQDNDTAQDEVLKLAMKEKNVFVNITYGNPPCRQTDALVDRLEHYGKVRLTQSEGLYDSGGLLLSFDEYCLDVVDDLFDHFVVRSCRDQHVVCGISDICVRKCCSVGYEVKGRECVPSKQALSLVFYNGSEAMANVRPAILQGVNCKEGKFKVSEDDLKKYELGMDGQLHTPFTNVVIGLNEYCYDTIEQHEGTHLFICFAEEWQHPRPEFQFRLTLTSICSSISAIFLLITFIIYAILPSLRNAHCRLIMCYLFTSMISYISVVAPSALPHIMEVSPLLCKILGYLMLFSFLSSFSWLNIISFDIWSTFRAVESSFFKKSKKTSKRFFLFCLYGWGFAAGWTALAVFCQLTKSPDMPEFLKPDIGQRSCWFSNYGRSRIPFFIIPVSVMVTFNMVLFIVTVKYCAQIKSDLKTSHNGNNSYSIKKYTADMNEFMINIKLFILMGLNWTMELISLTVEPENRIFFLISDVINSLEGIIIFCLFVLKRKVLHDLRITFFGESYPQHARNRAATFTCSTSSSVVQSMITTRSCVNTTP